MITRKIPQYNFGELKFFSIVNAKFLKEKFYISLPEIPCGFSDDKVLLSIPNSLELKVIRRSYDDEKEDNQLLRKERCFHFNEKDEWILQAVLHMQVLDGSARDKYILNLPLSAPFIKDGGIGIYFDGVWIRFMQNGEVLNENSGLDCFSESDGEIFIDDTIKDIKAAKVDSITVTYREEKSDASPAFYFPYGWNTNIGDVMSFSHNGVYHLIYLHDRRHHSSRNGGGAHYICQLTTDNMVDWYEQEPICEIDKPWLTYGTGTMVFHNGKYYMSYGLHTERYKGSEEKIEPQYCEETESYKHISFEEIFEKGGLPAGAAYSVSRDGIKFTPSNKLIHPARNPSAYVNDRGGISLFCGYGSNGIYEADSFDSPFKKSENDIDFIEDSIMGNTSECPALFTWNGYKYVMVGFTGYFRTLSAGSNKLVDAAALGEYVYDGLSVPMVAEFGDNRRIIAGWVKRPMGWGRSSYAKRAYSGGRRQTRHKMDP